MPTPPHRATTDVPQQRPYTAIPATRSSKRVLRVKQNVLIAAVLLGFLLGPLAFFVASRSSGEVAEVKAAIPAPVPLSTAGFAEIVARDYLSGRPTQLPVAEGVPANLGFTGNDPVPFERATLYPTGVFGGSVAGAPVLVSSFRVVVPAGESGEYRVYNLSVTTAKDPTGRFDVLAAIPYLAPAVFAPTEVIPAPAPNDTTPGYLESVPESVRGAISEWGRAYAAGDQERMRRLVDAPTGNAAYPLLNDAQLAQEPAVLWAVLRDTETAVVRARLVFASVSANGYSPSSEFDFLVTGVNGPNPRITAWGPPGSGPTLTPYQNNTNQ